MAKDTWWISNRAHAVCAPHQVNHDSQIFSMATDNIDVQGLITELRIHYKSVQDKAAFVALKQSELRPGDDISFFGFQQAREELIQEHALLAGHAHMVQESIAQEKITLSIEDHRLLNDIAAFSPRETSLY